MRRLFSTLSPSAAASSTVLLTAVGTLVLSSCSSGPSYTPPAPEPADAAWRQGGVAPDGTGGTMAPGEAVDPTVVQEGEQLITHTIQPGDSLWKIAREYRTTVTRIKGFNQLDSDTIIAGTDIVVPTKNPPQASEEAPAAPSPTPPAAGGNPSAPAPTTPGSGPTAPPAPVTIPAPNPGN